MKDVAEKEREMWEWEEWKVGVQLIEQFVTDVENFQMTSEQTIDHIIKQELTTQECSPISDILLLPLYPDI